MKRTLLAVLLAAAFLIGLHQSLQSYIAGGYVPEIREGQTVSGQHYIVNDGKMIYVFPHAASAGNNQETSQ